MFSISTPRALHTLLLLLLTVYTFQHECIHDTLESDIQINHPSNSMYTVPEGRVLLAYKNIQILFDSSGFTGVTDSFKQYILESLIPPVENFFQAALQVPSRSSKLRTAGITTTCSGAVQLPSVYSKTGVDADLVIFIQAQNDPSANYVASATPCILDTTTRRPIIGKITYNLARVFATTTDARREKDIVVTMHEITHILGFSNNLYKYYINPDTNKALKGHYYTKTMFGMQTVVLNLDPLTQRIRNHFGCPTLEGAYIENQGGSGSVGSHFERRIFYNEYMTASAIIDTRVTEFTLALLEGTGWYKPNYSMADPMTWGKNEGCAFVEGACMNTNSKNPNFKEFCSPMTQKTCSWTKRAGGACGSYTIIKNDTITPEMNWWGDYTASSDLFSDNCPITIPYDNVDCENSENQSGATLGAESYGYGSKCFMGTLYPRRSLTSAYPFCFKSSCKKTGNGMYYVEVRVGSQTVNCYQQQQVSVSGYGGALSCPDPNEFCGQVMSEGFCRRGCSARGSCINQECVCQDGWGGFDCSKPTYEDNCSRCVDSNPLTTSCYKDSCACNPTNATCMCPPGTQNQEECIQSVIDYIKSLNVKAVDLNTISRDEKNGMSTETIIAIACGSVGGLLALTGVFFGTRYVKRRRLAKNSGAGLRPRPPKLQIQLQHIETESNQDSPELTRKAMSARSVHDSPLIRHDSPLIHHDSPLPVGKTHIPSRFKTIASQIHPEDKEGIKEDEVQGVPLGSINKFHDIEEPKVYAEEVVGLEMDSPELSSPETKFGEPFEIKAQNCNTSDV